MSEFLIRPSTWFFDITRLCKPRLRQTGISRFSHNVLKEMLSIAGEYDDFFEVKPIISHRDQLEKMDIINGLKLFTEEFSIAPIDPSNYQAFVSSALAANRYPIYFSCYEELPDWSDVPGVTRAVTVHDLFHLERPEIYGYYFSNDHIIRLQKSLADKDVAITVSEYTRSRVIQMFGHPKQNIYTVHLAPERTFSKKVAIEVSNLTSRFEVGENYFVLFAQFDPRKNIETTLAGVVEATQAGLPDDSKCVIVASAYKRDKISELVEKHGLDSSKTVIVGDLTDEELSALYSRAKFLLFTSYGEGFGLPVVEALACGCPVITSSTTALPEVALDAALFVDPERAHQISDAITSLMYSESLRSCLSKNAEKVAARYSWSNTAREIIGCVLQRANRGVVSPFMMQELKEIRIMPSDASVNSYRANKMIRGSVLDGENILLPYIEEEIGTHSFFENDASGVHGVEYNAPDQPADKPITLLLPVKPLARESLTVYIISTSSRQKNNNQITLHIEAQDMDVQVKDITNNQLVTSAKIIKGASSWMLISITTNLQFSGELGLTVILAGRTAHSSSSSYIGSEVPSFQFGPLSLPHPAKQEIRSALADGRQGAESNLHYAQQREEGRVPQSFKTKWKKRIQKSLSQRLFEAPNRGSVKSSP